MKKTKEVKVKVTFFIEPDMLQRLKALSGVTRVKQADYLREGVEMVLERYKAEFKRQERR